MGSYKDRDYKNKNEKIRIREMLEKKKCERKLIVDKGNCERKLRERQI